MNRIGISIAIIFSAVIGLYLVILFGEEPNNQNQRDDLIVAPTYHAVNLNSNLFDDQGQLTHTVQASRMEHYQPLGFMVFEKPIYTIYLDGGEPWQITAEEGTLYDNSRIQLERNVRITNLNTTEYVKSIRTEYIEINLHNKTILSNQPVEIVGDNYLVESIGLLGDLTTQKYELKQHVQTKYFPQ